MKDKTSHIINDGEVEQWLFHHAQKLGHKCDGLKGRVDGDLVNIAYRDTVTGDFIKLEYEKRIIND